MKDFKLVIKLRN